jgi:hypothetical protein
MSVPRVLGFGAVDSWSTRLGLFSHGVGGGGADGAFGCRGFGSCGYGATASGFGGCGALGSGCLGWARIKKKQGPQKKPRPVQLIPFLMML